MQKDIFRGSNPCKGFDGFGFMLDAVQYMKPELAEIDDIRQLAIHHRNMFEEIWEQKGLLLEEAKALELEKAYFEKLKKQIPEGICKAWVVKKNGHILASGAVTIISLVPVPNDYNGMAYMHSVYTVRVSWQKACQTDNRKSDRLL